MNRPDVTRKGMKRYEISVSPINNDIRKNVLLFWTSGLDNEILSRLYTTAVFTVDYCTAIFSH